jgi:hypothetical protein
MSISIKDLTWALEVLTLELVLPNLHHKGVELPNPQLQPHQHQHIQVPKLNLKQLGKTQNLTSPK